MISFWNRIRPNITPSSWSFLVISKLNMSMSIPESEEKMLTGSLKREYDQSADDSAEVAVKKALIEKTDKIKKKKIAMMIAYSGQGYLGLQRNRGMKTIEEDVLVALLKAGFINDEVFNQPQLIQFQRAARTDKGVSAIRQILSMKLPESVNTEAINKYLPEQIRAIAIKRATKGFNSKTNCDGRTYSYTTPTFAFAPHGSNATESYRLLPEVQQHINDVLRLYLGTHNYHNFTSKRLPTDPSSSRYIMSFTCGDPFTIDDMEFAVLKVKGQSFMLHQIRKMVGLMISIVRGITTTDTLIRAYERDRLDIPIAPGLGLLLEEVHYDRYNQRYANDGLHEAMHWSEYDKEIEEFRKKFILPTIVDTEKNEKSMMTWLESLNMHSYDIRSQHCISDLDKALEKNKGLLSPPTNIDALIAAAQVVETAR